MSDFYLILVFYLGFELYIILIMIFSRGLEDNYWNQNNKTYETQPYSIRTLKALLQRGVLSSDGTTFVTTEVIQPHSMFQIHAHQNGLWKWL